MDIYILGRAALALSRLPPLFRKMSQVVPLKRYWTAGSLPETLASHSHSHEYTTLG